MPKPGRVVRPKRSDGLYPCVQFDSKGSCTFGDACKFSHLGKDDPGLPEGVAAPKTKRKRNGICLKFAEHGECEFGENCRYRHNVDSDFAKKEAADALLIATALGNKDDAQEEKLRRIMALPDHLKAKARAVFFAKQRKGDFKAPNTWQQQQQGGGGTGAAVGAAGGFGGGGGVCFAFQKGQCDRGSECKFSHEAGASDGGDVAQVKKTRIEGGASGVGSGGGGGGGGGKPVCFAFQTGSCKRGKACKFAHILNESAKAAAEARGGGEQACFAFQTGSCKRGDACHFAHVIDPTMKGKAHGGAGSTADARKRMPCRWFAKGSCSRGGDCFFSHGQAAGQAAAGSGGVGLGAAASSNKLVFD